MDDFAASKNEVQTVLRNVVQDDFGRLKFFTRYASWNGFFGAGVASLSARIARSRRLFMDAAEPFGPAADRSVLVASYFFDAARDEFDDRTTPHRDSHRCLAQAMLLGLYKLSLANSDDATLSHPMHLSKRLAEPDWLYDLNDRVAAGYGTHGGQTRKDIFGSIGYHLGSEVLADEEFTIIDTELHTALPELAKGLEDLEVEVGGEKHKAYHWVAVHSGHGGGAEADHFDWAVEGLNRALSFTPASEREEMVQATLSGFDRFAADHKTFFDNVTKGES